MARKLSFLQLAKKILEEEQKNLTAKQIWEIAIKNGLAEQVGSRGKTPIRSIAAMIYSDIKHNPDSEFVKIDTKPKTFYLKGLINEARKKEFEKEKGEIIEEKPITEKQYKLKEKELHQYLTYYLHNYLEVYSKTIRHQKSTKKKFAQWQHPDMVGVYYPFEVWEDELIDFSREVGATIVKIYSFEIKKTLDFKSLRESFFQTVSNSSWANESYLVAADIQQDDEFMSELKRLSTSFDIGVIHLDITDADSSQIILPARFRANLDWDSMSKMADINNDFKSFISRVQKNLATKEIIAERYDKIHTIDELNTFLATKAV